MNKLFSPHEEVSVLAAIIHAARAISTTTPGRYGVQNDTQERQIADEAKYCVKMAAAIIAEAIEISLPPQSK